MTQHLLQNRNEKEILWFQRRDTLKAAAAWVAMGGLPAAMAQQRSNIVELTGDALVNGSRLLPGQTIQTGDQIQTGPGSSLVFAVMMRCGQCSRWFQLYITSIHQSWRTGKGMSTNRSRQ